MEKSKDLTDVSSHPSEDVQQQRAVVDLKTGGKFTLIRDQGGVKILPFTQGQHYFWCFGTSPKIIYSCWELQMPPLVEKSEQKYWKQKNILAHRQFGATVLSFLKQENGKLNTTKLPSISEHSQRFLSAIHLHYRTEQPPTEHKLRSPICEFHSLSKNYPKSRDMCSDLHSQRKNI